MVRTGLFGRTHALVSVESKGRRELPRRISDFFVTGIPFANPTSIVSVFDRALKPREPPMSDLKDKVKDTIDDAAHAAKKTTDHVAEKVKDAAYETGKKVKEVGEEIKEKGK
jgi:hypothetical protein